MAFIDKFLVDIILAEGENCNFKPAMVFTKLILFLYKSLF